MNQSLRFSGQSAIITGGASGLGAAIAARLKKEGADITVFDVPAAAGAVAAPDHFIAVDVADEASVAAGVAEVLQRRGRIDILINCAGITGKTNLKSHLVTVDDFDRVLAINVRGSFLTSKHVLPAMVSRGYGRILHISSIAGKEGNAGMLAYSTSKAAVIGLTKVQGKEYAESGITINALAPAVVATPMVAALPAEQVRYMTDKIPMKRCGTLEEVAAMAAFIVSGEASFTSGFTFDLTGGRAVY
jgi:3-oxoacyl-[acyl-carrier protein] reductase